MITTKNMFTPDNDFIERKKKSIDQLMLNPRISKFLNEHHLTRQFIEQNWIDFLNYENDLKTCENCTGIDTCPKNFEGYYRELTMENGQLTSTMVCCRYGTKKEQQRQILTNIYTNLPNDILLNDFDSLYLQENASLYGLFKNIYANYKRMESKGFYIYGDMGIGKTYLMGTFCNMLGKQGNKGALVSTSQLILDIKDSFNSSDESNILDDLKTVEYLVLDDIGAESLSAWSRDEVLFNLLNARMLQGLPTYFTSVYNIEELEEHYIMNPKSKDEKIKAARLIERILALSSPYHLFGKNRR